MFEIFDQMMANINIFGFGSEPIGIIFSLLIATIITNRKIREEKKYDDTGLAFLMVYAMTFVGGISSSIPNIILFSIIVVLGMILTKVD